MKPRLLLGVAALAFAGLSAPQIAGAAVNATGLPGFDVPTSIRPAPDGDPGYMIARQGRGGDDNRSGGGNDDNRGRGRGGDDGNNDGNNGGNNGGDASGSGRSKPRVPGGSGCDDPGDVLEHAACRG